MHYRKLIAQQISRSNPSDKASKKQVTSQIKQSLITIMETPDMGLPWIWKEPTGWRLNLQCIQLIKMLDTFVFQVINTHIMATIQIILVHSLPVIISKVNRILFASWKIAS
jgi:hypothetical protein